MQIHSIFIMRICKFHFIFINIILYQGLRLSWDIQIIIYSWTHSFAISCIYLYRFCPTPSYEFWSLLGSPLKANLVSSNRWLPQLTSSLQELSLSFHHGHGFEHSLTSSLLLGSIKHLALCYFRLSPFHYTLWYLLSQKEFQTFINLLNNMLLLYLHTYLSMLLLGSF